MPTHNGPSPAEIKAFISACEKSICKKNACKNNTFESVTKFLKKYPTLSNMVIQDGLSPLMLAAKKGNFSAIKCLLDTNADIDTAVMSGYIKEGATALWFAAQAKQWATVKFLLENGAKKDSAPKQGATALLIAGRCRQWDIVRFILNNESIESNLEATSERGEYKNLPLIWHAGYGEQWDLVKKLLDKGVINVDVSPTDEDIAGISLFWLAAHYQRWDIVQILLDHKSAINIEACPLSNRDIEPQTTALYYAANCFPDTVYEQEACFLQLLSRGAEMTPRLEELPFTALNQNIKFWIGNINLIIHQAKNINMNDDEWENILSKVPSQLLNASVDKKTALQISIECENTKAIEALVRSGADCVFFNQSSKETFTTAYPVIHVFSKLQDFILLKKVVGVKDGDREKSLYSMSHIAEEIADFIRSKSQVFTELTQHKLCYQFASELIDCPFIQVSSKVIESILKKIPVYSPLYNHACSKLAHVLITHKKISENIEYKEAQEYKKDSNSHKAIWYGMQSNDPDMRAIAHRLLCDVLSKKNDNIKIDSLKTGFLHMLRCFEAPEVAEIPEAPEVFKYKKVNF